MTLKQVKELPLLSPPTPDLCPWVDVGPDRVRELWRQLKVFAGHRMAWEFPEHAAAMAALGIPVAEYVKEKEEWLRASLDDGRGPFLHKASYMVDLGFDVSRDTQEHETELRDNFQTLIKKGEWFHLPREAAQLKRLGIDYTKQIQEHQAEIIEELEKTMAGDIYATNKAAMLQAGAMAEL